MMTKLLIALFKANGGFVAKKLNKVLFFTVIALLGVKTLHHSAESFKFDFSQVLSKKEISVTCYNCTLQRG
jgi:hypothetical protein